MSRSRGKLRLARICPWCGTPSLHRDVFANDGNKHPESSAVSYICDVCFTGFSIKDSPRAVFVHQMYARDRQQRPTDQEHREFVSAKPLHERNTFELQRIVGVLRGKKPRSRDSREHIERSLAAVEGELARRGVIAGPAPLTFRLGEVCPQLASLEVQ